VAVSPSDGAVALRSLPRRFRAALRPTDDDNFDEFAQRVGSSGRAPLDYLVDANRSLPYLQQALEQVLRDESPVLPPAVLDASAREWPGAAGSLVDELGHLETEANAFADRVSRVASGDWTRTATVAGGGEVTALEILDEAVRTAIADLRAAETTMNEVRHR
jgi:hypothetical protein